MKKHDELFTFARFLGLSVITAHIVNLSVGEPYAFYTYTAMWLLALVILAIASPRHDAHTAHTQPGTAATTTRKA